MPHRWALVFPLTSASPVCNCSHDVIIAERLRPNSVTEQTLAGADMKIHELKLRDDFITNAKDGALQLPLQF